MCMCMHLNAHDCVCVPCKMTPSVNSQFLMRTTIPDFAISQESEDYPVPLLMDI